MHICKDRLASSLVVMHGVGEGVVQGQAQGARGAGRGRRAQHATRAPLQAARLHQQRARVCARQGALPSTPDNVNVILG